MTPLTEVCAIVFPTDAMADGDFPQHPTGDQTGRYDPMGYAAGDDPGEFDPDVWDRY